MILKEADDHSIDIAELKRLKESSPRTLHAAIQKQINNLYAGMAGERSAAHFLNREFGHDDKIALLHDLRIGVDGDFAQIDHLVIHRVQRTAWVLETKNYSGRLSCDDHGDWTVWRNNKPTPIPSPLNQARRHCETLRLWLKANDEGAIGKIHPVVLISPTSSVNRAKLPAGSHVVKSDNFGAWWDKQTESIGIATALGMVGRHMISGISRDDLVSFGERLVRAHVPSNFDWRSKLRLPSPDVVAERPAVEPTRRSAHPSEDFPHDLPLTLSTPHGDITITRIPDGRFALRNEKNDALIDLVRKACKGKGKWNPRFRNWLIPSSELQGILAFLKDISEPHSRAQ